MRRHSVATDGHRDAILGCVSAELAIVRVVREADASSAHVSLQPPHAGTAGEACVRAAVGAPPALEPGREVVHAVRRAE